MAEVINNSRSVIILSNSFLFNIANVMRESISSSNRKVYLVERSNNELIKPSFGRWTAFYSYPDRTMDKLMPVYK